MCSLLLLFNIWFLSLGFFLLNKCRFKLCVKPTSVQSLLEVNRGLMVVPKPIMLSMVPDGTLFSATTMASYRKDGTASMHTIIAPHNLHWYVVFFCKGNLPLHDGCWFHSYCHYGQQGTAALWWLCSAPEAHTASQDKSWASKQGCSGCPCDTASSQTPAAGEEERSIDMLAFITCSNRIRINVYQQEWDIKGK